MTLDRYGEPLPIEDDDSGLVGLSDALLDLAANHLPRSPDEIAAHCAELRAVLAEARERREAQP